MEPIKVVGVTDSDSDYQAIYVDGSLSMQDGTIYMCDIVEATNGQPFVLSHVSVDMPEDFHQYPDTIDECMAMDLSEHDAEADPE